LLDIIKHGAKLDGKHGLKCTLHNKKEDVILNHILFYFTSRASYTCNNRWDR
jgi:hypothetical protein